MFKIHLRLLRGINILFSQCIDDAHQHEQYGIQYVINGHYYKNEEEDTGEVAWKHYLQKGM